MKDFFRLCSGIFRRRALMPFELLTKHNLKIYAFDECLNLSKKNFFTQKKSWMFLFGNLFNSNKIHPN
jgi:hypothetical protein